MNPEDLSPQERELTPREEAMIVNLRRWLKKKHLKWIDWDTMGPAKVFDAKGNRILKRGA